MEDKSSELIKRILDVYLFSDMMFFKENKFLKRRLTRKEKEILEKNKIKSDLPYELIRKRISEYVDNYYYNTNIDDSVFNGFEEKKRNHLIKLNNSISILKQNIKNQILDKISRLLINEDESYLRFDKLSDYLKGLVETNDKKITALYGQIGFCVLLWNYEDLGYDTYRLINRFIHNKQENITIQQWQLFAMILKGMHISCLQARNGQNLFFGGNINE